MVFLTHNYPRSTGDLPGAFLHPLAVALRARGTDVRVVAPADRGQAGTAELDGVPITRVRYAAAGQERLAYTGALATGLRTPAGWIALAGLWRALRRGARREAGSAALIHAHWWLPAGLASPPELPLVVTLHGTDGAMLSRSTLARALGRMVFRRARSVTAVSSSLARAVEHTAPGTPVSVQPMPVATAGWEWSVGGGGVLLVGRLTEQKRVILALEAFALARAERADLRLTVVGDGPLRDLLRDRIRELGLAEGVRLRGSLEFAEVRRLLRTADAAMQLGRGEGFGLAAAEALMAGVPVLVCNDGGGLLDIVTGPAEGAIAAAEPGAIAQALLGLLADPDARSRAQAAGTAWRSRLDPAAAAARFQRIYQEALGHA